MQDFVDLGAFCAEIDFAISDLHVEAAEEGGEELTTNAVWHLCVKGCRIVQEIDEGVRGVDSMLNALYGTGELLRDRCLLQGDLLEPLAQLVDRKCAVCGKLDQSLLLPFELLELLVEGIFLLLFGPLQLDECSPNLVASNSVVYGWEC